MIVHVFVPAGRAQPLRVMDWEPVLVSDASGGESATTLNKRVEYPTFSECIYFISLGIYRRVRYYVARKCSKLF